MPLTERPGWIIPADETPLSSFKNAFTPLSGKPTLGETSGGNLCTITDKEIERGYYLSPEGCPQPNSLESTIVRGSGRLRYVHVPDMLRK